MGRSHALAGAAIVLALLGVADPRLVVAGAVAATTVAITGPRRWLPEGGARVAMAVGAWLIVARVVGGGPDSSPAERGGLSVAAPEWPARVDSVVRRAGGRQDVVLDAGAAGLVYARLPRYPEFGAGDRVAVVGRREPLASDPPPGQEGWVGYLRRIGVDSTVEAQAARLEERGVGPQAWLGRTRVAAGDLIAAALPEPLGGLAAAVLIGLRERVDPALARDFTTAGLSHVVAISGWNIAIVAGVCGSLTRHVARRRRSILIGAAVAGYALAAGASPSVVRAALMTGLALLAREGGRRAGASRALALALALMLVVDPRAIVDPSFQLSSAATAGLLVGAGPLAQRLARVAPGVPGVVRESLGVSLAAQAATLPLVLLDFGRLSLVAPLANLVAAPLVPFVMAAAALALPLGAALATGLPPLAVSGPLAIVGLPLQLLVTTARLAAEVPFASVTLPASLAVPAAAIAALVLLAALSLLRSAGPRAGRP